ncbi:MAG: DUF559 domain-containing protein [Candidatus Bathyarchaeia archaeon]
MTPEQEAKQTKAAHDAVRGMTRSREELLQRALIKQNNWTQLSAGELEVMKLLNDIGIQVIPQYALDIFNIDLAVPDRKIAIEVDGGEWHNSGRKQAMDERKEALLKAEDWLLLRFNVGKRKFVRLNFNDAITLVKAICSLPTTQG